MSLEADIFRACVADTLKQLSRERNPAVESSPTPYIKLTSRLVQRTGATMELISPAVRQLIQDGFLKVGNDGMIYH